MSHLLGSIVWLIAKVSPESIEEAIPRIETPKEDDSQERNHEINRLKMILKFSKLAGKEREIEREWQTIQQNEHDAYFKFQTIGQGAELEYIYKKGIADGIKWAINRFS